MSTSNPASRKPGGLFPFLGALRFRHYALAVFLLLSLRLFRYFPGLSLIDVAWPFVLFVYLLFGYLPEKAHKRIGFSTLELFALLLMMLMPIYSALLARLVFGQPLVYGILTQRGILFGVAALAIGARLRAGTLSSRDIERTVVALACFTLVLYLAMTVLLDPAHFAENNGLVSGGTVEAYAFKFNDVFIVIGFFYYAFRGFRERRAACYVLAAVFFSFIVIVQGGRSELLALIGTFLLLVVRWGKRSKLVVFIPKALLGAGLLAALLFVAAPDYTSSLVIRTGAALDVVTTGQSGFDASANARITETELAMPYVARHWLFGNGDISERWGGGYSGIMHGYFYPSDIGVVGVVFVYGVVGLLLFLGQFWFAWRAARRMRARRWHSPLGDALLGFVVYTAVHSVTTGGFVWNWEASLAVIIILYWMARRLPATAEPADADRVERTT